MKFSKFTKFLFTKSIDGLLKKLYNVRIEQKKMEKVGHLP